MSEQIEATPRSNIDIAKERQKPRLISILFCDFANQTSDGKTNLLGIFDSIYVHPVIRDTPTFVLFIRTAETYSAALDITLIAPNNDIVLTVKSSGIESKRVKTDLPVNIQTIVRFQFKAIIEGVYWFDVTYMGESLGGSGLPVMFRETEDRASGTDTYSSESI